MKILLSKRHTSVNLDFYNRDFDSFLRLYHYGKSQYRRIVYAIATSSDSGLIHKLLRNAPEIDPEFQELICDFIISKSDEWLAQQLAQREDATSDVLRALYNMAKDLEGRLDCNSFVYEIAHNVNAPVNVLEDIMKNEDIYSPTTRSGARQTLRKLKGRV